MEYWFHAIAIWMGLSIGYAFYAAWNGNKFYMALISAFIGLYVFTSEAINKENTLAWGFLKGIYGVKEDK